ncbi:alpha/beta hydrolase [Paenibacillus sacheonensis]|uniref:Carboxylesterase n=1 Tax=Paenibacillus sacheonensis TaxID=742054 RepID=A0A7X5BWQ9_9BACL|nr:alpha/beta hydrolase [Paenibacillus sacheonensis]MBM7564124.1 phospholipase/carboxylesterase [Paenibacillus sacheonensis]NBC67546.1 carboxylesterase [Paenibacillus sacheonensis]
MKHIFQPGTDSHAPVLLMLHGTGGDEHDLLPLAKLLSPSSAVLSVRGNVLENGMPRFFRRLAEGIFDEEDLRFRTKELYAFLDEAASKYGFSRDNVVAVGYSNGANIAGSLLFHYSDALQGAVLHHPMVPLRNLALPDLTNVPVFIGAGTNDPICTASETEELTSLLQGAGADVTVHWEQNGHRLSSTEVNEAATWFASAFTE